MKYIPQALHVELNDEPDEDESVIVVDRDTLLTFVQFRLKAFNPALAEKKLSSLSDEELERLIDDYIREEVCIGHFHIFPLE